MQGRFKRDGSAAAEQEPRGGTDRGSSPQHAQNRGPAVEGASSDASATVKAKGRAKPKGLARAKGKSESAAGQDVAIPKAPTGSGSRLAMQNWRISTRLVSLLTLPVVAATTLGGFRINDSLNDIAQLDHMQLLTTMTRQATNLAAMLQEERDKSAGPLSVAAKDPAKVGTAKPNSLVQGVRDQTDAAAEAFAAATDKVSLTEDKDETLKSIRNNILQIGRQLTGIEDIRKKAYDNGAQQTVTEYNALIVSLLSLSQDMAQATSNPEMIKRTRALASFSSAKEYASIQRAIIAASLPESGATTGTLKENDRLYALSALRGESQSKKTFELVYQGRSEELTASLGDGNPEISKADHYTRRVLSTEGQFAKEQQYRSWMDWYDADGTKLQAMKTIELSLLEDMEQKARELRNESQQDAIINGALIFLVLGVSLVGAFVMARSMIRSLRRLQDTATRVAQDRLPELVKQLSESDPQDVDTSVESVGLHTRDEIGQVAAAFDDVHREAVRLAAEQALLRGNVNAMFTNLSRRSQGLIQRQLSLISELESREADPDQLSSLFKLDHLATRMRRNGENLLVLAGEEPGRRWTRPVPLVDVLRAAASEVEQYERIELSSVPGTDVAGRVVNDLVHLLAELLENATSFSSPQTKVKVTGHALPDGRVLVEIHDTGIGLSPEDLAAINERLASPPTVDVSVSRRMGLFVVGRLSLRHGIRIQLRPSDSGGTTALVMLPVDVAQGGKKPAPMPGQGGPGGSGAQGGPQGGPGGQGSVPGGNSRPPVGAGQQRGQVSGGGQRPALPGRDGSAGQGPQQQRAQGPGQAPQGGPGTRPQQGGSPTRPQAGPGAPNGQGGPFGGPAPLPGRTPGATTGGPQGRPGQTPPPSRRATGSSVRSSRSPSRLRSSRTPGSPPPRPRPSASGRSCRRAAARRVRSSRAPVPRPPGSRRAPVGVPVRVARTSRAATTSCRAPARRPSSPARTTTRPSRRPPAATRPTAAPASSSVPTCAVPWTRPPPGSSSVRSRAVPRTSPVRRRPPASSPARTSRRRAAAAPGWVATAAGTRPRSRAPATLPLPRRCRLRAPRPRACRRLRSRRLCRRPGTRARRAARSSTRWSRTGSVRRASSPPTRDRPYLSSRSRAPRPHRLRSVRSPSCRSGARSRRPMPPRPAPCRPSAGVPRRTTS